MSGVRCRKLRHYSVIPFLLSISAYSELTEIKMFTGINIVQSLHVCKRVLVWYPLAYLHGLKQKYFQHCEVTNCPAPRIENVPNRDTTVSYRTEPWILWTVTPLIDIDSLASKQKNIIYVWKMAHLLKIEKYTLNISQSSIINILW